MTVCYLSIKKKRFQILREVSLYAFTKCSPLLMVKYYVNIPKYRFLGNFDLPYTNQYDQMHHLYFTLKASKGPLLTSNLDYT